MQFVRWNGSGGASVQLTIHFLSRMRGGDGAANAFPAQSVCSSVFVRKRRLRRLGQPRERASSALGDTQLSRPLWLVNRYDSPSMSTSGTMFPKLT